MRCCLAPARRWPSCCTEACGATGRQRQASSQAWTRRARLAWTRERRVHPYRRRADIRRRRRRCGPPSRTYNYERSRDLHIVWTRRCDWAWLARQRLLRINKLPERDVHATHAVHPLRCRTGSQAGGTSARLRTRLWTSRRRQPTISGCPDSHCRPNSRCRAGQCTGKAQPRMPWSQRSARATTPTGSWRTKMAEQLRRAWLSARAAYTGQPLIVWQPEARPP